MCKGEEVLVLGDGERTPTWPPPGRGRKGRESWMGAKGRGVWGEGPHPDPPPEGRGGDGAKGSAFA